MPLPDGTRIGQRLWELGYRPAGAEAFIARAARIERDLRRGLDRLRARRVPETKAETRADRVRTQIIDFLEDTGEFARGIAMWPTRDDRPDPRIERVFVQAEELVEAARSAATLLEDVAALRRRYASLESRFALRVPALWSAITIEGLLREEIDEVIATEGTAVLKGWLDGAETSAASEVAELDLMEATFSLQLGDVSSIEDPATAGSRNQEERVRRMASLVAKRGAEVRDKATASIARTSSRHLSRLQKPRVRVSGVKAPLQSTTDRALMAWRALFTARIRAGGKHRNRRR